MNKRALQAQKTRQDLMAAFWTLYQEKEISKITVGQIVKIGDYNRGTFYKYFTDIYDLLEKMEEELLENIRHDIQGAFSDGLPKTFEAYSLKSAGIFQKYQDKLFVLLGPTGDPKFGKKLQRVFMTVFYQVFHFTEEIPHFNYVATFMYSAMVGLLTYWHESEPELSSEEFVALFQKLLAHGVMGYLHLNPFLDSNL